MLRAATQHDIPAIIAMVAKLHASVASVMPMDRAATSRFLRLLVASPVGWVRVWDAGMGASGFLAASIGSTSVSMLPVAGEHGWWAERGGGLVMLRSYMEWAKEQGCFAARMSTPPHNERAALILQRCGFELAEQAWVKVL
jgi:RimJ/RimL family protein N-acetyltransferase